MLPARYDDDDDKEDLALNNFYGTQPAISN